MRNLSVFILVHTSKCTARVEAHVKRGMYTLGISLPTLTNRGPEKPVPVTANGYEGFTRSDSNGTSICCPRGFIIILHTRNVCRTLLIAWRTLRNQNSFRRWDNTTRTSKWCNWMWVCRMSNSVKRWAPSSTRGCRSSPVRSAHCSRLPKRTNPSSKNGLRREFWTLLAEASSSVVIAVRRWKLPPKLHLPNMYVQPWTQ